MKCSRCGLDSRRKDRPTGTCAACHTKFAFDPQRGHRFTDQGFKNAIARVSSNGSVKFTLRNLFYEVYRLMIPSATPWFVSSGVGLTTGALLAPVAASFGLPIILGSAMFALVGIFKLRSASRMGLTWEAFQADYALWVSAHGVPEGLLTSSLRHSPPPAEDLVAELSQYSFDRAVITDHSATADLLLGNGFHFENNCAVLSFDGHPAHAFAMVREMLRKNPKIEVFALHDCTPEGCTLAWKLRRDPKWFRDIGQVYDVALRPAQARKMRGSWVQHSIDVPANPAITEKESVFLQRYSVELAAIRPEQLVKRLFRAMTLLPAASPTSRVGNDGTSDGSLIWASEASASDGGGDAFG